MEGVGSSLLIKPHNAMWTRTAKSLWFSTPTLMPRREAVARRASHNRDGSCNGENEKPQGWGAGATAGPDDR